jgi:hypothetical protein
MSLSNIPLSVFREFLKYKGLNRIKAEGGHEKWSSQKLRRPVILQTHIDPVPEFIIRNNLRTMDSSRKELEQWIKSR